VRSRLRVQVAASAAEEAAAARDSM
jgi:hypothetical protein